MFSSKKDDCRFTPVKKLECNRLLYLTERSNSGDVILTSLTEIKYHFSMLLDPMKCYQSIQLLNKIAQRQHFSVITEYYDNIFKMINNASTISDILRQKNQNQSVLSASEIVNQCLNLVDKIASFPSFFLIIEEIKLDHIKQLYDLLPNEVAFKALGKLLVLKIDFAKQIINLGIDKIVEKITELDLPLFIWFLGSFAYFSDLNELMLPFYEEFIINNSTSQNETIRKFCYDALYILISNSTEMCNYIKNLDLMTSIFKITPVSQACAKKYIKLASLLLSSEITVFLKSGDGAEELISVLQACFKEEVGLAVLASEALILIVRMGFLSILTSNRIDDTLFSFTRGAYSFKEKQSAMKALCFLFLSSDMQSQIRYLSLGFADIVSMAVDMGDSELHSVGIASLQQMMSISNINPDIYTIKASISEILELLSLEEYDQVVPPCSY